MISSELGLHTGFLSFFKLLKANIRFEIDGSDAFEEEGGEIGVIVSRSLEFGLILWVPGKLVRSSINFHMLTGDDILSIGSFLLFVS